MAEALYTHAIFLRNNGDKCCVKPSQYAKLVVSELSKISIHFLVLMVDLDIVTQCYYFVFDLSTWFIYHGFRISLALVSPFHILSAYLFSC